jgi:hypothetical protein
LRGRRGVGKTTDCTAVANENYQEVACKFQC